ncbi:MAG: ABC transporter permease [Myxococcales bacterium]|nr:ABC transporter permease [Myxococcales bacterium]
MTAVLRLLETLGSVVVYLLAIVRSLVTGPRYLGETVRIADLLVRRCLVPVGLAVAPVGAVISLQSVHILRSMGTEGLLSSLLATSVFREFSPALASVMVAAQAGSSIAARIGTMKVRGQIDALAVMSVDPIRYVVVPGLVACALITPLLNILATILGIASGWLFAVPICGVDHGTFMVNLYSQVSMVDLYVGMAKCLVFGTAVGLIAGYLGLQTSGGAEGVGRAANNTVVYTIVFILVADYAASMILLSLGL